MTTAMIYREWVFNAECFFSDIKKVCAESQFSTTEVGELLGLSENTVRTYIRNVSSMRTWQPTINTYLRICNVLDLDPTEYWYTEE